MGFQSRQTIGNMSPYIFKRPRPDNVVLLVESCLEFNEHGNLFALFGSFHQCLNNRRITANPVKRLFYREDIRIKSCLIDKINNWLKRIVRVVE